MPRECFRSEQRYLTHAHVRGFGNPLRLRCGIGVAACDTLGAWGNDFIVRADAGVDAAKRLIGSSPKKALAVRAEALLRVVAGA